MRRRSTAFSIARARRNAFVSRALESRLAAPPSRPMTCFQSRLTSDSWVMEPWNHKAIQPVNLYFSAYAAEPGALVFEPLEAACPCRFNSAALLHRGMPQHHVSKQPALLPCSGG